MTSQLALLLDQQKVLSVEPMVDGSVSIEFTGGFTLHVPSGAVIEWSLQKQNEHQRQ